MILVCVIVLVSACKKPKPGHYMVIIDGSYNSVINGTTNGVHQEWDAEITSSTRKYITFSSPSVNGRLDKKNKKVQGVLSFGGFINPSYTISVNGSIVKERYGVYFIEGTYTGGKNETDTNNNLVYTENYYTGNIKITIK